MEQDHTRWTSHLKLADYMRLAGGDMVGTIATDCIG